jgi:hypothetical protein
MSEAKHPKSSHGSEASADPQDGSKVDLRRTRQIAIMLTSGTAPRPPAPVETAGPVKAAPPRIVKTPTTPVVPPVAPSPDRAAIPPAKAPIAKPASKIPAPSPQPPAESRPVSPAPPRLVPKAAPGMPTRKPLVDSLRAMPGMPIRKPLAASPLVDEPLMDPITSTGLQRAITGVLGMDEDFVGSDDAPPPPPVPTGPHVFAHPTIVISPKHFCRPQHGRYCRLAGRNLYVTFEALAIRPQRSVEIGPFPTQGGDETVRELWDEARLYFAGTGRPGEDGHYPPFEERAIFILDEGEHDPEHVSAIPPGYTCLHDDAKSIQEQTADLLAALKAGGSVKRSVVRKIGGFGACLSHHDHFLTFARHHAFIIDRLLGIAERRKRPHLLRVDLSAADYRAIPPPRRVDLFHQMLDEIAACVAGGPTAVDALPPMRKLK